MARVDCAIAWFRIWLGHRLDDERGWASRRRKHGASVIKTRRKAAVNFGTKECASDFVAMADDEAMDSTDGDCTDG